ncbi:Tol-Pal system beta propeller repeat protein TolB [Alkanindiges sp. WGS2144]|uniref:Tol-Pal system beta propeller repeat protein TolB n=1 Tax=Alkanindiges sp. WGS2144 TaxID=3366808 RepID=UPI0037526F12
MLKLRLLAACIVASSAFLPALTAQSAPAALTFEVAKAFEEAPQIAVVPFASDNLVYSIVQSDLQRSGKFNSSSSNLPEQPASSNEINVAAWQNRGIPYVVVGKATPSGDGVQIQYELFDVKKNTRILGEVLQVPASQQRAAGHLIADKIYQALTGIPGDFSGQIAYVLRNRTDGKLMYTLQIADTDGQQPKTILESPEPILSPAWTPDAHKLAYVSFETKRPAIYLQDVATGQREVLAQFKGLNGAPSISPDGRNLLFTGSMDGNPEIYQMNIASKRITRLTRDSAIDTEARYAPDGKSFIFTSDRGGTPQIYRYNLDDGSTRRLTFSGPFNARGTLSSDGRSLALVHRKAGSQYQVAVQDLASGVISILTPTPLDESPSFSPNGQMVVYATREGSRGMLSIMSIDGRFRMRLPSEQGEVREPAWAPRR